MSQRHVAPATPPVVPRETQKAKGLAQVAGAGMWLAGAVLLLVLLALWITVRRWRRRLAVFARPSGREPPTR